MDQIDLRLQIKAVEAELATLNQERHDDIARRVPDASTVNDSDYERIKRNICRGAYDDRNERKRIDSAIAGKQRELHELTRQIEKGPHPDSVRNLSDIDYEARKRSLVNLRD
jgi:hypothetical protein